MHFSIPLVSSCLFALTSLDATTAKFTPKPTGFNPAVPSSRRGIGRRYIRLTANPVNDAQRRDLKTSPCMGCVEKNILQKRRPANEPTGPHQPNPEMDPKAMSVVVMPGLPSNSSLPSMAGLDSDPGSCPNCPEITGAVKLLAAGLASTITKFRAVVNNGGTLPAAEEISQAITQALSNNTGDSLAEAEAMELQVDKLANEKLAAAKSSGGGKGPKKRQSGGVGQGNVESAGVESSLSTGVPLPAAIALPNATAPLTESAFHNATALTTESALPNATAPPAESALPNATTPLNESALPTENSVPQATTLPPGIAEKAGKAIFEIITKFNKAKELPNTEEITQVLSEALKETGLESTMKFSTAVKTGLDALADKKISGGKTTAR